MRPFALFRATAIAEALSWTGLLVGMYLKYVEQSTELGVWLFGRLHGALFVAYLVATAWVARAERWSLGRTLLAVAAAVPPLTSVLFERWVTARRRAAVGAGVPRR